MCVGKVCADRVETVLYKLYFAIQRPLFKGHCFFSSFFQFLFFNIFFCQANEQVYISDIKDSMSTAAAVSLMNSEGLPIGR